MSKIKETHSLLPKGSGKNDVILEANEVWHAPDAWTFDLYGHDFYVCGEGTKARKGTIARGRKMAEGFGMKVTEVIKEDE